jgi:ABC-type Fe3+-hydroxamate transport system substrate-binding protein
MKESTMSKQQIKKQIEETAKITGVPAARLITAMQAELARMGDEAGLAVLCEIKRDYQKA